MNNPFTKLTEWEIEADKKLGDGTRRTYQELGQMAGLSGPDLESFVSDHYAMERATVATQLEAGTFEAIQAIRARCRQILTHSAAADRPALARYLALETDTPAAAAIKQLSTAPAESDAVARFILEV